MTGTAAAAHVLVGDVDAPEMTDESAHHLRRVLRLRPGETVTVTDGAGRWRACILGTAAVEPSGPVHAVPRATSPVVVAFAITKGTKPELVVQKLTELGIDRIIPFKADRSVVRWPADKAARQHDRWIVVARGALEQSRGCWLPAIDPVGTLDDVVHAGAVPLDRGGRAITAADHAIAVGPEGGWTDAERDRLPAPVGLAPGVLRAETAAIAGGALLAALRSSAVQ